MPQYAERSVAQFDPQAFRVAQFLAPQVEREASQIKPIHGNEAARPDVLRDFVHRLPRCPERFPGPRRENAPPGSGWQGGGRSKSAKFRPNLRALHRIFRTSLPQLQDFVRAARYRFSRPVRFRLREPGQSTFPMENTMRMGSLALVIGLLSTPAVGGEEQLYGTWKLTSMQRRIVDTGQILDAFGPEPRGFLTY